MIKVYLITIIAINHERKMLESLFEKEIFRAIPFKPKSYLQTSSATGRHANDDQQVNLSQFLKGREIAFE